MIDASAAMRAVSASRTSPTRMTSGSARSVERNALGNVMPARVLIWICFTPSRRYSTGSSTDTMLLSRVLTDEISA